MKPPADRQCQHQYTDGDTYDPLRRGNCKAWTTEGDYCYSHQPGRYANAKFGASERRALELRMARRDMEGHRKVQRRMHLTAKHLLANLESL